jgi:hypothetical protein
VDGNVPGVGPAAVVSHVEPSRRAACTAYATFERKFMDDLRPYAFRTTDCGATWTSIAGNLPEGAYLQVLREDPRTPDVLYAGTETGLYVSVTGGGSWFRLGGNLPAVPVHEVLVHGRENDLIVATHGRGAWILDDASVIQELAAAAAKPVHLFGMRTATRFATKQAKGSLGDALFRGPNPAYGAIIRYHLASAPAAGTAAKVEIVDAAGTVIRTLGRIPVKTGINTTAWDLAHDGPRPRRAPAPGDEAAGGDDDEFWAASGGPRALPGRYTVRLTVGSTVVEQPLQVRVDPTTRTTPEGLKAQFDLAMELRALQSLANDTLRALDTRRGELEARRRGALALPNNEGAPVAATLGAELAQLDSLVTTLTKPANYPYWSEGPRVSERISNLLRNVDSGNFPPTGPQRGLSQELAVELRAAMERVRQFLARQVMM